MEENKSKKVNKNKIKKIVIIGIIIICVIATIIGIAITGNVKKTEISSNLENTASVVEGETLFEDIGHYGVAIAGNNNADRGTAAGVNVKLITNYPENWNEIKKNIPSNILSRVNNMSGSRLDFDGKIKKCYLTMKVYGYTNDYIDILLIKPDGTYEILNIYDRSKVALDIVESGWYYISFLDAPVQPQHSWGIIAIYENLNLTLNHILLKNIYDTIYYNKPLEVYYDNKFKLREEYELFGILSGGLSGGWTFSSQNSDKVEAILDDGTYKQLYQSTYNGKLVFEGRTNTDFVNGTFNAVKSHNIRGGEMDYFYEKLGKNYFNNKEVVGYRFTQLGTGSFGVNAIGLLHQIYSPEFSFNIESIDNLIESENVHIKTNITNSATDEEGIGYDTKITCKLDEALSDVTNIVVKINGNVVNVESVYNADTNEIVINGIDRILPSQTITVEYDVKVNNNIQNKGEINSNVELPIVVNIKSYPIDINSLEEAEQEKYRELYVEEENAVNVSGVYKKASGGVEVKYIDEVTGEEIEATETKEGFQGEEYTTVEKNIAGYEVVEIPANKVGTMSEEKITVVYKYRKVSKVIVKYIDLNNGDEIDRVEGTYKEGENYTSEEKELDGYRLISIPEEKAGVVEREDIVVEYGYKKIVIGVEVKYIDEVIGEEIEAKETITGIEGENYTTNAKEISGYELVETPINVSGVMREDLVTVTYKYRKLSKVIVRYVDKNSSEEFDRVESTYKEGDSYETNEKEISGYKLVKIPVNANGVVGREDIEVVYEYSKIAGGIEVKYIDEVTNEEIETSEHEVGLVGEEYTIKVKDIVGYEVVEVPENEKGIMSEEKIIVTYKYRKLSKVIVMYIDKVSNKEIEREEVEYKEGDGYKVNKKEFDGYNYIETVGKVEGIVERSNIEVKHYYEREKVLVKVEINIVDERGNIIETIEKEGYIGYAEEIELPEIDGYYTESKTVTIEYGKENDINVVYKKKMFDLPNTSDINIYVYIGIFIVSIIVISLLIINNIKKQNN